MKFYGQQVGVYSLNKGWKFIEKLIATTPEIKNHIDIYGYAKGGAALGPASSLYDDSDWQTVTLPHDWVTKKDFTREGTPNQGYKERGTGWYRMRFELEEADKNKQISVEFEGLSAEAELFCNGMLLKKNNSGYNSFVVDLTDVACFGSTPNTLAVFIDACLWEGWWYEGAGIYRNVWLVKKEAVHVQYNGLYIKTEREGEDDFHVAVETTLENSFSEDQSINLNIELFDRNNQLIYETMKEVQVNGFSTERSTQNFTVNRPNLWSVDCPYLYSMKASVIKDKKVVDYIKSRIGFRTIELTADTGFWQNGKSIKLKGFCNHQDHAGVGVAVPYAIKEYRIKLLKDLGANAYRCAHNPDPEILDICDELGMLVMEEYRNFNTSPEHLFQIKEMVKNSRNHPSVVLYSVFNEEPLQGTMNGHRLAKRLRAAVREMDQERPVLGAFNGGYFETDGAITALDAVGINYNPKLYDEFHQRFPAIPIMGTETASAFMVRGEYQTDYEQHIISNYDEEKADWGNTVREAWEWVNERDWVAGCFVWTGFDYRGEPTPFEWPSVGTFFGTYDSCGFKKDACYLYQAFWKNEPIMHILPHWNITNEIGKLIKVMIVTNCDEVKLFLNDKCIEKNAVDQYKMVSFQVPYEPGTLKAIGYKDGKEVADDKVITAEKAAKIYYELSKETMMSNGLDAVAVNMTAVDHSGIPVPDADFVLQLQVDGGVEIAGVGNGNPNSHEPDLANSLRLFHGKGQVILRNIGETTGRLRINSAELPQEEVAIPVENGNYISDLLPVKEKVISGWKMFYELFDTMPPMNIETNINDMNRFQNVGFHGKPQAVLDNKYGKYALYRTDVKFSSEQYSFMQITLVYGTPWIFLDGKLLFHEEQGNTHSIMIPLQGIKNESHRLDIIILNSNKDWPYAGIGSPVLLKERAEE